MARADSFTGHVIGLDHEHQRPDAAKYLKADCTAVRGYAEAKLKVMSVKTGDEPAVTAKMSVEEKMNLV